MTLMTRSGSSHQLTSDYGICSDLQTTGNSAISSSPYWRIRCSLFLTLYHFLDTVPQWTLLTYCFCHFYDMIYQLDVPSGPHITEPRLNKQITEDKNRIIIECTSIFDRYYMH